MVKGKSKVVRPSKGGGTAVDQAVRYFKANKMIAVSALFALVLILASAMGMIGGEAPPKPKYKSKKTRSERMKGSSKYTGSLGYFLRFTDEDNGEAEAAAPKASTSSEGNAANKQRARINGQVNAVAFIRAADIDNISATEAEKQVSLAQKPRGLLVSENVQVHQSRHRHSGVPLNPVLVTLSLRVRSSCRTSRRRRACACSARP
jgi:hypothetical protein